MRRLLLGIALVLALGPVYSQHFYALAQGGAALGTPYSGAVGEASGGIRLRNWQLGVATGIDNAGATGVPLLADVRWTFWRKKTSLGLFSQEGWNFITQQKQPVNPPEPIGSIVVLSPPHSDGPYTIEYSGGAYWMGGLSWHIPVGRAGGFLLSAGSAYRVYSATQVFPTIQSPAGWLIGGERYGTVHREWKGILMIGWEW